jgi:ATP-dependent helicase HrpA
MGRPSRKPKGPRRRLPAPIREALDQAWLADVPRLRRAWERLPPAGRAGHEDARKAFDAALAESRGRVEARRASKPRLVYPDLLPVSARTGDIAEALRAHQVVVVCGETGSGKTTQLPKLCLEMGLGTRGLIGHTQPRRLAARAVAARIAEELDEPLGQTVGYKIRFTARVGKDCRVKLMTDGILLNELRRDRLLRQYDALIIDEAHERSLNIDFLLGYLRRLLPRRPDLRIVITSATIDPERLAAHFGDAPVVEVSGRTYPVEVRHRPPDEAQADENVPGLLAALDELRTEPGAGDILVFLPGERDIREAGALIRRHAPERRTRRKRTRTSLDCSRRWTSCAPNRGLATSSCSCRGSATSARRAR